MGGVEVEGGGRREQRMERAEKGRREEGETGWRRERRGVEGGEMRW